MVYVLIVQGALSVFVSFLLIFPRPWLLISLANCTTSTPITLQSRYVSHLPSRPLRNWVFLDPCGGHFKEANVCHFLSLRVID